MEDFEGGHCGFKGGLQHREGCARVGVDHVDGEGGHIGIKGYNNSIQRYALHRLLLRLVALVKEKEGLGYDEVLAHAGLVNVSVNAVEETIANTKVERPVLPWNEPSHTLSTDPKMYSVGRQPHWIC